MFRSSRRARVIDPGSWPDASLVENRDGKRVLVENADSAELWARAEVLREAGYRVATCRGSTGDDGWLRGMAGESLQCPLIEEGRCALVEEADVVVSDCGVGQSEALLAAQAAVGKRVVFAAPTPIFDRYSGVPDRVRMLAYPVTAKSLLNAVAEAVCQET